MQDNLPHPQSINPDAMYRARDCARLWSVGLSTWWHWSKTRKIKPGLRVGPKTTVWPGSYLIELREKLIAEAGGEV